MLAFEGGVRYSDYSTAGGVSYKAGRRIFADPGAEDPWSLQRAVRAPNVIELYSGATNTAPQATDFCNATGVAAPRPSVLLHQLAACRPA
jgi:iron complex outermembrane receptor protein